MRAPVPADEPARLAALRDAQVLDTPPEEDFDDIALLASEICRTPMGLVSLIDENRQWFKAKVGVDLAETSRDLSFCSHTIVGHELLEVPDAAADDRFSDNPLVRADGGIRFYAGAPVILDGVHAVGTVCVVDVVPHKLDDQQRRALRSLARHAAVQLEMRRYARHAGEIADRLRQLDRMKDSFLTNVSHELRTPLSTIRGYIEMLLEGDIEPETGNKFLGVMERNADRLLHQIDELLLVARMSDATIKLKLDAVDLADLAGTVITACQGLAGHHRVRLVDRTRKSVPAKGDAKQLAQAINHLVVNAVKFTEAEGEVVVESGSDGEPELIVTDTGIGIAEEDLPHVFDRFYRCPSADVMAVQGPGLGLAIVKSIVDAHQGSVTLESQPGTGTTVRLYLPKA